MSTNPYTGCASWPIAKAEALVKRDIGRGGAVGPHKNYPYERLVELYDQLQPGDAVTMSRLIGGCAWSEDVFTRSNAVRFFQARPQADGGWSLCRAFLEFPHLYEGVEDPLMGATGDLMGELLRVVVANKANWTEYEELLPKLRELVVTPERSGSMVAGLLYEDRAWMLEHAKEVLTADPKTLETYVLNLLVQEELVADGAFERLLQDAVQVLGKEQVEVVLRERLSGKPELLERGLDVLDDEI